MGVSCSVINVGPQVSIRRLTLADPVYLQGKTLINMVLKINGYDAGRAPRGFPAWPYNKVRLSQKVFFDTWQAKLDMLQAKQAKLAQETEQSESWPSDDSDSVSILCSLSSGDTNAD